MPSDHAIARFTGGPFDGAQLGIKTWPPPEQVTLADLMGLTNDIPGHYERGAWSQLTDEEAASPHLVRGVMYGWTDVDG